MFPRQPSLRKLKVEVILEIPFYPGIYGGSCYIWSKPLSLIENVINTAVSTYKIAINLLDCFCTQHICRDIYVHILCAALVQVLFFARLLKGKSFIHQQKIYDKSQRADISISQTTRPQFMALFIDKRPSKVTFTYGRSTDDRRKIRHTSPVSEFVEYPLH